MEDRMSVAVRLAERLHRAEMAVEAALAEVGQFYPELVAARAEAGLSASSGQTVWAALGRTSESLVSARGGTSEMHKELDRLRRALRLDRVHAGPPADKPPEDTPVPKYGMAPAMEVIEGGRRAA